MDMVAEIGGSAGVVVTGGVVVVSVTAAVVEGPV